MSLAQILGIAIVALGLSYYVHIESLERELLEAHNATLECERESKEFETSLELQTQSIERNKAQKEEAQKALKEFLSLPVKERVVTNTVTIYKEVNSTREDRTCEDYKKIEANTYELDWN